MGKNKRQRKLEPNPKYADLELAHILMEIEAGRGGHLRHFMDQWYCYKHGLVSSKGNAKWDLIYDDSPRTCYSNGAKGAREKQQGSAEWWKNPDNPFVKEHVIPQRVIKEVLISFKEQNYFKDLDPSEKLEHIECALGQLLIFAIIEKSYDIKLNGAELKDKMPNNWGRILASLKTSPPTEWHKIEGFDKFARYRELTGPWKS